MRLIIVWHNLNYDTYYYKIVKGFYSSYNIGYVNKYNHKIILVIPISNLIYKYKVSPLRKVLRKFISFLQKIEKKL